MKLPASKIEACVSVKDCRTYLNYLNLNVERNRVEATNGHFAAIIPVEVEDGDVSGPVSVEAIKAARKLSGRNGEPHILANGSLALPNGQTFPRVTNDDIGRYPDIDRIMPNEPDRAPDICINADYLAKLAQALGSGNLGNIVKIWIDDSGATSNGFNPIVVQTISGPKDGVGVLMQCRPN